MIRGSQGGPAPKVKVKQDTIDLIKAMGMKAALKKVATSPSFKAGTDSAAAFKEGVRRMYGDTRFQNALYTPKASPGPVKQSQPSSYATYKAIKENKNNPANR
jgi:hypothetical protein